MFAEGLVHAFWTTAPTASIASVLTGIFKSVFLSLFWIRDKWHRFYMGKNQQRQITVWNLKH